MVYGARVARDSRETLRRGRERAFGQRSDALFARARAGEDKWRGRPRGGRGPRARTHRASRRGKPLPPRSRAWRYSASAKLEPRAGFLGV